MKQKININVKTVKQAAAERGQTESYVYRLIREGKIKTVEIAGKVFIAA